MRQPKTIEVIFATSAPAIRQCPVSGFRTESLVMAGADLSRLRAGTAPFLAGHRTGIDCHLGIVTDAWIVGNEARATIRLSRRAEVRKLVRAILAGDLTAVSVAYWSTGVERVGEGRDYFVTSWIPNEISICAVGADANCRVIL